MQMGELATITGIVIVGAIVPLAAIAGAAYFGVRLAMRRKERANGGR
jgi:hypothetical protein